MRARGETRLAIQGRPEDRAPTEGASIPSEARPRSGDGVAERSPHHHRVASFSATPLKTLCEPFPYQVLPSERDHKQRSGLYIVILHLSFFLRHEAKFDQVEEQEWQGDHADPVT